MASTDGGGVGLAAGVLPLPSDEAGPAVEITLSDQAVSNFAFPHAALTMSYQDSYEKLSSVGLDDRTWAPRLTSQPLVFGDLQLILSFFHVTPRSGYSLRPRVRTAPTPPDRKESRRNRYKEHQGLHRLGQKVLVDDLKGGHG